MGIGGLPMVSAASVFLYASVVMKASSVILASVFGINPDRKPETPSLFRSGWACLQVVKAFVIFRGCRADRLGIQIQLPCRSRAALMAELISGLLVKT